MIYSATVILVAGLSCLSTAQGGQLVPLNITALSSRDGSSVIECWQLASVPSEAMSALNYEMGDMAKSTWSIIQPRTIVGEAWAPTVQISVILNGLIRITSPAPAPNESSSMASLGVTAETREAHTAYVMPGTLASSVVIAADTKAVASVRGHLTEFPSDEPTVLVQIPFRDGAAPEHRVLHDGPCRPALG